jgi:hypothetical protein
MVFKWIVKYYNLHVILLYFLKFILLFLSCAIDILYDVISIYWYFKNLTSDILKSQKSN